MHRDHQLQAGLVFGLFANPIENFAAIFGIIADVLLAHQDHVLPRLPRVETERHRQARLAANRMLLFKLRDLCVCPAMKWASVRTAHAGGRATR